MNRLFEALSDLKTDLVLPKDAPCEAALEFVIHLDARDVDVAEPMSAQEVDIEPLSPNATPPHLYSSEPYPPTPVQNSETQMLSLETVPLEAFLPYEAPPIPAQDMEADSLSPETMSPDVCPPDLPPPTSVQDEATQMLSLDAVPLEALLPQQPPPIPTHDIKADVLSQDAAPQDGFPFVVHPPISVQDAETQQPTLEAVSPDTSQSNPAAPEGPVREDASCPVPEPALAKELQPKPAKTGVVRQVSLKVPPESRLVAVTDSNGLGAEKFRALVTRLEHLQKRSELKCFQVTSSVINEGKTLVSANVALTLAKNSGSKTLLIEGDLHRPTLGTIFGLNKLRGLSHWWSSGEQDLDPFVQKFDDLPLWFLPAGPPADRASDILRSPRFVKAFERLASQFEWIVVDSTPMLPIVDVNLWSRLVDGTVLVIREGVTPVKALKQGLLALDHPNIIGVVLNEASATNEEKYNRQYYGSAKR